MREVYPQRRAGTIEPFPVDAVAQAIRSPPPMDDAHFTEPTTAYWQAFAGPAADEAPPWRHGYPARLPDGRRLVLPIRRLAAEPRHAVASLILNQASFEVAEALADLLAARVAAAAPDVVVGLPTLGLPLAAAVARRLGHARAVPLGTSRKFWYDDALSVPVQSITSPTPGKRLYLDPHQRPLVAGRRVLIVDDAVSTGVTLGAAWSLLEALGAQVVGAGVAMRQGRRWADALGAARAAAVTGVFDSPLLQAVPGGWVERA